MSHSICQNYPISLRVHWIMYFTTLYSGKSSLSELEWLVIVYSCIYIVWYKLYVSANKWETFRNICRGTPTKTRSLFSSVFPLCLAHKMDLCFIDCKWRSNPEVIAVLCQTHLKRNTSSFPTVSFKVFTFSDIFHFLLIFKVFVLLSNQRLIYVIFYFDAYLLN